MPNAFESFVTSLERSRVVVDIDGTETIDSAGLTALLSARDTLRETGGDVKISTSNPVNQKILEITRLDEQIEVFDSVIDAVQELRMRTA